MCIDSVAERATLFKTPQNWTNGVEEHVFE